ncbi:hypothetical protein T4D_10291 [Trichinella pseudospiralis]|uniref:Uncharacterized protein n=1 Tax=Trichinella pseudospiralis TaxID=6337 RepID=A0A0V1G1C5_TRIPS|nr:hypothetical protein T4D_10291 [Trichinella pseudospiralis]
MEEHLPNISHTEVQDLVENIYSQRLANIQLLELNMHARNLISEISSEKVKTSLEKSALKIQGQ